MQAPQQHGFAPILGGFVPMGALWAEDDPAPIFRSEASARWFVRTNREQLVAEEAIALHAGRIYVHRERLEAVAKRVALGAVARPRSD